jgi:hypothetical protein
LLRLRASLDLAAFLGARGRGAEAEGVLSSVLAELPPGSDCAEREAARAVLANLSATSPREKSP